MNIETPPRWRKGQTIFNFLWWLEEKKGYSPEMGAGGRMADPFHIADVTFDILWKEFLKEHGVA